MTDVYISISDDSVIAYASRSFAEEDQSILGVYWECPDDMAECYAVIHCDSDNELTEVLAALDSEGYRWEER